MKRFISLLIIFITISTYGYRDIVWGLQKMPYGDTDLDSVNIREIYEGHYIILTKKIEQYDKDKMFIYYNLFVPKQINDSVFIIYKMRVKTPRTMKFIQGRYTYGGETNFEFGNKKERFMIYPCPDEDNIDIGKVETFAADNIDNPTWSLLHSKVEIEISHNRFSSFYQAGNNRLFFSNIKKREINIYAECLKSLQVVSWKEVYR